MENVAGRCDRIAPVKQRLAGAACRHDQPQGHRLVPTDLPIPAGSDLRGGHHVACREHLRRLAVEVTRLQCFRIGFGEGGLRRELILKPSEGRLHRPTIEPIGQPQRKEVPATPDYPVTQPRVRACPRGQSVNRDSEHTEASKFLGLQRVLDILRLDEVGLDESILIYDQDAPRFQITAISLKRRRIHGDQGVHTIPCSSHLP